MHRQYGKSVARHAAITQALYNASNNGVPCEHEADFYAHKARTGNIVKIPHVVKVPKGFPPCTTP